MDSVSGPSFGRVQERPFDHKAEISPRQHPPESTILLKSTAKKNKNPDLCLASPNAKYQF